VDRTTTVTCNAPSGVSIVVPILSESCGDKLRFEPTTGIYGYSGSQETIFSRCVQVTVPPSAPDNDIPAGDQMEIVSTVTWDERGLSKNVVLRERLYNWK
jgi:hypothetical protein